MADVSDAPSASAIVTPLDQAVANDNVEQYREVRRAERAGKEPPTIAPTPAESAPAQPVDQAASTDATPKPASEPGKPKKNADTRVQELLADRDRERSETARLRTELEELRRRLPDVKPVESSPAKPSARDYERYKAMSGYPQVAEFEDYGDYTAEVSAFVSAKRLEEFSDKARQDYDRGQHRESQQRFDAKGLELFPDFREVLTAAGQAGRQWPEHVTRKVLTHEQGPAIAYALAKAKDDTALYARIADPVDFGEYVASVLAQKSAPKPVPQKTSAPDPPMTLGSQPFDRADELETAVSEGNVANYRAMRLRQRMAGRK